MGEGVVGGEIGEAVPVVIDAVDQAVIGAAEFAAQLQVIRRVGEDAVDRGVGEHAQHLPGIAEQNLIQRQFARSFHGQDASSIRSELRVNRLP